MTTADLKLKGRQLYSERRYSEAIPLLKEATDGASEDENLWQQLVLANHLAGHFEQAAIVAKQGLQQHERSAWLWMQLGSELIELDRLDEAETALDRSHRLKPREPWLWRYNARLHRKRKNLSLEIDALETLVALNAADGNDLNWLGIAHRNNGNLAKAVEYYGRSVATAPDVAALFNMGLAFATPELSQDIDATDAHRRALLLNPKYEKSREQLNALKQKLSPLAVRARQASASLFPQERRFDFYVSPIEALNLVNIKSVEDLEPKAVRHAKRELFAAIELEGTVSWLDDFRLDKARAIAVLDELDDHTKRAHHLAIFQNKPLLRFLTRGEVDHFLYSDDFFPSKTLELLDREPGFRDFLSKPFAQQFNLLLSRAIDRSEMDVVEALFDGRRWCNPEHDDTCFAHAFERTQKLVEVLESMAEEATKRKIGVNEISDWLRNHHVVELFNLLPVAFRTTQSELVSNLRALALACHNKHGDSRGSHAILLLCNKFQFKSAVLNERLKNDFATIAEILATEKSPTVVRPVEAPHQRAPTRPAKNESPVAAWIILLLFGSAIGVAKIWNSIGMTARATRSSVTTNATSTDRHINSGLQNYDSEIRSFAEPERLVRPSPVLTGDDIEKPESNVPLKRPNAVAPAVQSNHVARKPTTKSPSPNLESLELEDLDLPLEREFPAPKLVPVRPQPDPKIASKAMATPDTESIENSDGIAKASATVRREIPSTPPPATPSTPPRTIASKPPPPTPPKVPSVKPPPVAPSQPPTAIGETRRYPAAKPSLPQENQSSPKGAFRWKLPSFFPKRKTSSP